jgi:NDP-sugar pyrophosphorylase family protein
MIRVGNTGLYLLEQNVWNLIPDNHFFDMTDLIKKIQENGLKVGLFPVFEKSWIDVGQWEEYTNAIKQF